MNLINGLHFNNLRGDIYGGLPGAGSLAQHIPEAVLAGILVKVCLDIIADTRTAGRAILVVSTRSKVTEMPHKPGITDRLGHGKLYKTRVNALKHALGLLDQPAQTP